jgi:hypothetical protein
MTLTCSAMRVAGSKAGCAEKGIESTFPNINVRIEKQFQKMKLRIFAIPA